MSVIEAYEAAAVAICAAIQHDADSRKANGSSSWKALLDPSEFHDRCYRMARFAVLQDRPQA